MLRATAIAVAIALSAASLALAATSSGPAPPRPAAPKPGTPGPAAPRAGANAKPSPVGKPAGADRAFTLLYGDDHCFGLVPPQGWVIDDSSGMGSKIRVVLYPKGQKWSTSATVMYVNPIHQPRDQRKSLQQMIDQDVQAFLKQAPRGKVTSAPQVKTRAGKLAEVRLFAREGGDPQEAVAYVMEEDLAMLLVLSSREIGGVKSAMPAFREMVGSYQFVAASLQTPTQ